MGLIVGVVNQKGGSAKSTLAQALGSALASEYEKKVLIIDTDSQKTSVKWYGRRCKDNAAALPLVVGVDVPSAIEGNAKSQAASNDFVFLEGGAGVSPATAVIIRTSDVVIIPVQAAWKDFESTVDTVALVKQRQELTGGLPRALFVVTRSNKKEKIAREITDALLELGLPVLDAHLSERSTHRTADLGSKTALEYRPQSLAAKEVLAILQELVDEKVIAL